MSILSVMPDGMGYYYGFAKPDMRSIDVRCEDGERIGTNNSDLNVMRGNWVSWIAGNAVACSATKEEAEAKAIAWLKAHPREPADVED
jgi:hypothetical protein